MVDILIYKVYSTGARKVKEQEMLKDHEQGLANWLRQFYASELEIMTKPGMEDQEKELSHRIAKMFRNTHKSKRYGKKYQYPPCKRL